MKARNIFVETVTIFLIILWLYASMTKLMDYSEFRFQLERSPYIHGIARFIAIALPIAEIFMAIGLMIPRLQMTALYGSYFTMFMFTGYIYAMLNYSDSVPCSCGGILNQMSWTTHLWFNVGVTLLTAMAILTKARYTSVYTPKPIQVSFDIN